MRLNKELTTNGVVRVFESFSGVGTQVMGLHRLKDFSREHGLEFEFESTGISDWNIPSIISYGAIHGDHELPAHKDLKKYLDTLDKEDLISLLLPQRLSFNDKTEATEDNYRRRKVEDLRDLVYYSVVSKNKGNIQLLKGKDIKDLDLFTYSFPCQDISVAGKGAGFKDTSTRSGLVWEVVRVLSEQDFSERPKVLLMENVKALTFKNYEEGWTELQEIIEDLGYTNYYDILTATDYGVAQSRERVFMVSVRNDIDFKYEFPEPLELTNTLEDYLEPKVGSKYYISEQMLNGMRVTKFNQYSLRKNLKSRGEIANTIVARFGGAPQVVIDSNDNEEDKRTLKEKLADNLLGSGVLKGGEIINHSYTNSKSRPTPKDYIESDNGIMPTPTTRPDTLGYVERQGAGIRTRINEDGEREPHIELRPNDSSNCLTTFAKDSVVVELETQVIDKIIGDGKDSLDYEEIEEMGLRVRKFTPREAWRLMGIEDKYFDKVEQLQSNSVLYKQAGNAIVVDVLYHIFRTLYLEGER